MEEFVVWAEPSSCPLGHLGRECSPPSLEVCEQDLMRGSRSLHRMRGGMWNLWVPSAPGMESWDFEPAAGPTLTFPQAKQNVRLEHFSSLATWGVFWVLINSMPSTLPGPWVNE